MATTDEAIRAVSRLLATASGAPHESLEQALVREARAFTGASVALLLGSVNGSLTLASADPLDACRDGIGNESLAAVRDALARGAPRRLDGAAASALSAQAGLGGATTSVLLLPAAAPNGRGAYILLLADRRGGGFSAEEVETGAALASAAAASLVQLGLVERHAAQVARQSALARAAKALNGSLDLSRVLPRICREASDILAADTAGVYRGSASTGLVLEATTSSPELIGTHVEAGSGIAGRAVALGRPLMSGRDVDDPGTADRSGPVRSALAAPMRWDGEVQGVLYVGWYRARELTDDELDLLESFAELAAIACRNASVHAGLSEAARKDGLTGCLNHAALHETLRREMQRSRRTGRRLSIVIVDLDHFKQVNEEHGHLMGDEVLRRVGRALREAVRPYDFVARYGGDEFVIVAVDAREERAAEIAERAIGRLGRALEDVLGPSSGPHATAGVAEWHDETAAAELVREADRALLFGKQQGVRGAAVLARAVPDDFVLGRPSDEDAHTALADAGAEWPSAVRRETEPLRRRAQQLALISELGARVAGTTSVAAIAEAAVGALERAFVADSYAVVRAGGDGALELLALAGQEDERLHAGAETGLIELSVAEKRIARDTGPPAVVAVPIRSDGEVWGALELRHAGREGFEDADVRLLDTVAAQLGAAIHSARLYEQLEQAYLQTSEALSTALEARDPRGGDGAVAKSAEELGRRLGIAGDELRALRYAAVFRDIGKSAIPEAVLTKPGPLSDEERRAVERHTLLAEELLARVEFLAPARALIRHSHERFDGSGYPDGLAGEQIPAAARVLSVCDAHDAMTRDRPYRAALSGEAARAELAESAGTQFDPHVVETFLAMRPAARDHPDR